VTMMMMAVINNNTYYVDRFFDSLKKG